ncbi:stage III sporulation protein SpoAB [Bacillus sp. AGMB 02131]|uniref:Stage III sporulation protein SpoAB n=1 Tax=Peribacillus faecalis TaxID=2772559 RepID=A0A927CV10_9BACI|nr:stage III sporulation protein SpoIIIAB [Peribacillus faecalis]MBD3108103.1 stage III sporulation protein SpoAB [Peribacillus faecalis]
MIKIVGAALIFAACTILGFQFSRHLSERPKQLRYFKTALQALEAEIMFGHIPLQEASVRLSKQMPKPVNLFFNRFSANLQTEGATVKRAWTESLKSISSMLALQTKDLEILEQFGETLGKHDRFQQQKQIALTMTHLEREENEALLAQSKYEKMIKSLGVLVGLLLIILLV